MAMIVGGGLGDARIDRAGRGRRGMRPLAEVLELRQLLAVITVNSAGDVNGADGSATLTLGQAIEVSDGNLALSSLSADQSSLIVGALATPNTIDFAIPGAGPFVIEPTSSLPAITSPVVINGDSQAGAHPNTNGPGLGKNTVIEIELDGTKARAGANGLDIQAGGSTVEGLAIGGFASGAGILAEMQTGDLIQGDFLGTDAAGTAPLPNASGIMDAYRYAPSPDGFYDIAISGFNTIGGTADGAGNVISGNVGAGLGLAGMLLVGFQEGSASDLVEGNFIGTDLTGSSPLPNGGGGIADDGGAMDHATENPSTIGGTAAGAGNLISGNGGDGLLIGGYSATVNGEGDEEFFGSDDLVQGNRIGTDVTGTRPLPNTGDGILVMGSSSTIGGTAAGAGNLISGNSGNGLAVKDASPRLLGAYVLAQGNLIGTPITGIGPLPNGGDGIAFDASSGGGAVGESTAGAADVIAANVIANNRGAGVAIAPASTATYFSPGYSILGNSIVANGALGISYQVATYGEPSPPVLASVTPSGSGSLITGTLDESPSVGYRVELFANNSPDPSGSGQGQTYLGSTTATTDASGQAHFAFATASPLLGLYVSATATPTSIPTIPPYSFPGPIDTSEFSRDLVGDTLATTTVTLAGPGQAVGSGQPVTLSAAVASTSGIVPTGEVAFSVNGVVVGTPTLDGSGLAVFTTDGLAPGPYAIRATYLGDSINSPGSSNALAVAVVAPTSTVALLGGNRVATQGQPITFTAAVTSTASGVPGGQVAFLEDGVVIGSAPLPADGLASFITDQLLPGPHVITADYLGDGSHPAGLSGPVAVEVTNATAFGGPSVTSDLRVGPESVRVAFNRGLLIGPAQDLANYRIIGPRRQVITIKSAVYNPADASVTLTTAEPLDPQETYQLTINGQTGERVVDVFGIALNGRKEGKPGHNYSEKIQVEKAPVVKVTHPKAHPRPTAHAKALKKGH